MLLRKCCAGTVVGGSELQREYVCQQGPFINKRVLVLEKIFSIPGDITAADPIVSRESVTYVTMLFGIEHADPKSKKGKIVEKMDATIMISAAAGAAIGGAVTGGMLGMAAGTVYFLNPRGMRMSTTQSPKEVYSSSRYVYVMVLLPSFRTKLWG